MAFLYEELAPERKDELTAHLQQCPACAAQVSAWRAGVTSLGDWKLPRGRRAVSRPRVALQWAAAAVLILGFGFVAGRQTSPRAAELAEVKKSVAQLAESLQRERSASFSNAANAATIAANAETMRLLAEYSQLQEGRRTADQRAVGLTLQNFETRLARLRAELETVAMNTENGFEQTHENLNRLASFSAPARNEPTP